MFGVLQHAATNADTSQCQGDQKIKVAAINRKYKCINEYLGLYKR